MGYRYDGTDWAYSHWKRCTFDCDIKCKTKDFEKCNAWCICHPDHAKRDDSKSKAQIHLDIVTKLNALYEAKNNDYGDSFAEARRRYPNAIMIRLWDKILRLDTLLKGTEQKVNDESIDDTLRDLANYALMELVEREIERVGK